MFDMPLSRTIDSANQDDCSVRLQQWRQAILADPALQHRLVMIEDPDQFIAANQAEALHLDIALLATIIADTLQPDPLGLDRFDQHLANASAWPGPGWRPIGLVPVQGDWAVDWAHFAGQALTQPFYEDALRTARRRPFNRLMRVRTSLTTLIETAPAQMTAPDGLIFHLSRCGSTLVAQMLAAIPGATIVSEPPPLDGVIQLIQANPDLPTNTAIALVRAMAGALGWPDHDGATGAFVIKLDSWHSRALPLLRLAFPDTPWIFLYREPIDILVSHHRIRGMQAVPGMLPDTIFDIPDSDTLSLDEYAARVLATICQAVLDQPAMAGGMLVNYSELPDAVVRRILPHFGILPDPASQAAITAASTRNAKAPHERFTPDTAEKRHSASPSIIAAAALVADAYRALEEQRHAALRDGDAR